MVDIQAPDGHYFTTQTRLVFLGHDQEVALWKRRYILGVPIKPKRVGYAATPVNADASTRTWRATYEQLKAEILNTYTPKD